MKFLPERTQPETRKEVLQLYAYFVVFLVVFLIALWYEESLPLKAFAISAVAKIMENMLSEAWQLGKQKKSDKQEEIVNKLDAQAAGISALRKAMGELLQRGKHLPPRDPLSPSLPYEDEPFDNNDD